MYAPNEDVTSAQFQRRLHELHKSQMDMMTKRYMEASRITPPQYHIYTSPQAFIYNPYDAAVIKEIDPAPILKPYKLGLFETIIIEDPVMITKLRDKITKLIICPLTGN